MSRLNSKKTAKLGLVIAVLLLAACGIKGPPLPPIDEETIQRQKLAELASADQSAKAASADASQSTATPKKTTPKKKSQ